MSYQSCKKHPKIKWNTDEVEQCPLCVYGSPLNQPKEITGMNAINKNRMAEKEKISQKQNYIQRQIKKQKEEAKNLDVDKFLKTINPEVFSSSRKSEIVDERMKAIVVLKETYGLAYAVIGRLLKRDHSSVISLFSKYKKNGKP